MHRMRPFTRRWSCSIVQSQMTKTDLLARPVRRHHVADLHLAVGDDHPVDQELDQGPSLLEGGLGQTLPHPSGRTPRWSRTARRVPSAGPPALRAASPVPRAALALVRGHLGAAGIRPAPPPRRDRRPSAARAAARGPPAPGAVPAGAPGAPAAASFRHARVPSACGGLLGMAQQVAEVGPHQLVQPPGRAQARWAFLLPMREQGGQLAGAGVVALPWLAVRARQARPQSPQLTRPRSR